MEGSSDQTAAIHPHTDTPRHDQSLPSLCHLLLCPHYLSFSDFLETEIQNYIRIGLQQEAIMKDFKSYLASAWLQPAVGIFAHPYSSLLVQQIHLPAENLLKLIT